MTLPPAAWIAAMSLPKLACEIGSLVSPFQYAAGVVRLVVRGEDVLRQAGARPAARAGLSAGRGAGSGAGRGAGLRRGKSDRGDRSGGGGQRSQDGSVSFHARIPC
jgi:hypothetical protein